MKREKSTPWLVKQWVDEQCDVDPALSNRARGLFLAWKDWLERVPGPYMVAADHVGSPRAFSCELRRQGFPWHRVAGRKTRIHVGLKVRIPMIAMPLGIDDREARTITLHACEFYRERYR